MLYFQGKYIEVSFDFKGDTTGGAISNCKYLLDFKNTSIVLQLVLSRFPKTTFNCHLKQMFSFHIRTTVNFYVKQATPSLLRWQLAKTFWRNFSRSFRLFPTFRRPATNACKRSVGPNAKKGLIFNIQWEMEILIKTKSQKCQNSMKKHQKAKQYVILFHCNSFSWFPF